MKESVKQQTYFNIANNPQHIVKKKINNILNISKVQNNVFLDNYNEMSGNFFKDGNFFLGKKMSKYVDDSRIFRRDIILNKNIFLLRYKLKKDLRKIIKMYTNSYMFSQFILPSDLFATLSPSPSPSPSPCVRTPMGAGRDALAQSVPIQRCASAGAGGGTISNGVTDEN